MIELDQMWAQMIEEASRRARAAGRHDVADYLDLKAGNDALRGAAIQWLVETSIELAMAENSRIAIERDEPHNFSYRNANLVGVRLRLRYGVRCLTIEAGWTRTPADGFMRGGALAVARFSHFGMQKFDRELLLRKDETSPIWFLPSDPQAPPLPIDSTFIRRHLSLLTAEL